MILASFLIIGDHTSNTQIPPLESLTPEMLVLIEVIVNRWRFKILNSFSYGKVIIHSITTYIALTRLIRD